MQDFDGDISKLANHRKATPFATGGGCLRVATKPPEVDLPKFHTGGAIEGPVNVFPAIVNRDIEHIVPNETAKRLREITERISKNHKGKVVTVDINFRDLVTPILKNLIERTIWSALGQFPFMLEERPQRLVVIESPFGHPTKVGMEENAAYARQAMLDSLKRGEAPYASHLLYTQCLDDLKTSERKQGMEAGFAWGRMAQHVAVYTDRGVSRGMLEGIKRHQATGKTIEFRSIK